ncbi:MULTISPECIES: SDR family NAD(P)-dependent oxidoreductase [unclassified Sphingobium]|uniref:SDR family NAD(P)-dependent oxidoreductase n=1 Tax=unclassified Sphingobium TaxID=2611147 RepID=UPI000D15BB73|nr:MULTISPECIES: SDR family NAD(P)-dependent oxidoreductase [unclassified Sphingobium]MBG6120134.1 NAD(P)-dependent dehydrogenase (short-subunit alcohol dehydrogenase family) [Sphingobium sp. JAI105]PSO12826.1 short-chain dehydrogenase [Sphingobium sp. AEW4]TWD05665.1 NAD(P)-dependent dehydrogenase (short-subunit alcohol dehydrogenase family) [Sphingobium sp. AEW010]TWD23218.1 NAD(P)-dependent dehydrogenase (short-subunit alcohol dehydrogenase family) [Sphingobium sp. AEW013]TWD25078.1 NAD(P)-
MPVSDPTLRSLFAIPDKVAIVTGAASGIGKATARLMADAGAKLVVADLDGEGADAVAQAIVAEGGEAIGVQVDVSDEAGVKAMAIAAVQAFGGIDVLVNNAAYRPKAEFMTMAVEDWDRMHAINTRGTFLCMREAIRVMAAQGKERGGAIVNISTIGTAHPTIFNNTHYDSSKAGVNSITRTAAAEFAPLSIRVNAVMPGGVDTEGSRKMRSGATPFVAKGPIMMPGRMVLGTAQPIQLASAILFLASPAASYMTGHIMAVDGGYLVG